jgi:hypothetical protein
MIDFKIFTGDLAAVMGEVNRRIRDGVRVIDPVIVKGPPSGTGGGGGIYKAITDVVPGKEDHEKRACVLVMPGKPCP